MLLVGAAAYASDADAVKISICEAAWRTGSMWIVPLIECAVRHSQGTAGHDSTQLSVDNIPCDGR